MYEILLTCCMAVIGYSSYFHTMDPDILMTLRHILELGATRGLRLQDGTGFGAWWESMLLQLQ